MTLSALAVFAAALMVAAGSPGPSIAALVARVLTNGLREVVPFLVAMWIGEAVWLTLAVAGMAAIAATLGHLFILLRYAGAAYLIYLALRMWNAPLAIDDRRPPAPQLPWKMFGAGLAVSLGNPKIMVFYLALLPTIVDIAHVGMIGWAELVATMLLVLIAVDLAWALSAARARRLLSSRRPSGSPTGPAPSSWPAPPPPSPRIEAQADLRSNAVAVIPASRSRCLRTLPVAFGQGRHDVEEARHHEARHARLEKVDELLRPGRAIRLSTSAAITSSSPCSERTG